MHTWAHTNKVEWISCICASFPWFLGHQSKLRQRFYSCKWFHDLLLRLQPNVWRPLQQYLEVTLCCTIPRHETQVSKWCTRFGLVWFGFFFPDLVHKKKLCLTLPCSTFCNSLLISSAVQRFGGAVVDLMAEHVPCTETDTIFHPLTLSLCLFPVFPFSIQLSLSNKSRNSHHTPNKKRKSQIIKKIQTLCNILIWFSLYGRLCLLETVKSGGNCHFVFPW